MADVDEERIEAFEHVVATFPGVTSGGWQRRACPRCEEIDGKPDYKLSLGFNPKTFGFNCFKCGMKGSLPHAWQKKLTDADPADGPSPPKNPGAIGDLPAPLVEVEMPDRFMPIFSGPGENFSFADPFRSYVVRSKTELVDGIKGRGMSWETAKALGIGISFTGHTTFSLGVLGTGQKVWPPLRNRVVIPIFDLDGTRWLGWVARDITGRSQLPYRYPKNMNRELLFNEAALYRETSEPCFINEGVFDTTLLYPDAVACMGKPLQSHLRKFAQAKRPLVVCLDGDAWEEGWALAMTLRHLGKKAGNIRLPPKTDPDEVPLSWLRIEALKALV